MPTQRTSYGVPFRNPRRRRQREVAIEIEGGFHGGVRPRSVPPGYMPVAQNVVREFDGVLPRSGLSKFSDYDFNGPVLGAFETFDVEGKTGAFASSNTFVSFLHPDNLVWSDLSYVPSTDSAAAAMTHLNGNLSGSSTEYFRAANIYDPTNERIIAVFSNNTNSFKFFDTAASSTTFSDFSWPDSFSSTKASKDLTAINDRLVFFNTLSSDGTRFPTRVMWSARGNPLSFEISDGAGAEDLMDMKGDGQAIIRFREYLILFSEFEIWRGIPTLDAYGFRFERVIDSVGTPWPKTIAVTPAGVIFLGLDKEVYITDGASLTPLGPIQASGPSRIQKKIQDELVNPNRAFALYNQTKNRYELYYPAVDSTEAFCGKALFYYLNNASWWPQSFPYGLSAGVDISDPATLVTWDDLKSEWDTVLAGWNSYNEETGKRRPNVFDSTGSTYRFQSLQTTDGGTAIDVRLRTPAIASGTRQMHLKEVWIDHESPSNSSASVWMGSSASTAFDDPTAVSLTTNEKVAFVPVWKTHRQPAFELRINDGGTPRIDGVFALVQEASKF